MTTKTRERLPEVPGRMTSDPADPATHLRRSTGYCLRCYTPLQEPSRPVEECVACGFLNTRQARASRWTLEPRFVALESACKLLVFLLSLGTYIYFASTVKGTSMGLILAVPAVFGVLWATASKITHRMPYFNAGVFWSGSLLALGLLPALGMALQAALFRRGIGDLSTPILFALPFLLLSRGVLLLSRKLEGWKQRRTAPRITD